MQRTDNHSATTLQSGTAVELFVYGTLKHGYSNHAAYCHTATQIRPAYLWGRLYQLEAGYPGLVLPQEAILAVGSSAIDADIQRQERQGNAELLTPSGAWEWVYGELLTLSKAASSLPSIDSLEEFNPSGQSEYLRVLTAIVCAEQIRLAWTYILATTPSTGRIHGGVWRPQRE